MEGILTYVWNIGVQAGIIFCVLLAVRGLFSLGRVPKKYACALWIILFIRLLLPIRLETPFGIMPENIRIPEWARIGETEGSEEDRDKVNSPEGLLSDVSEGLSGELQGKGEEYPAGTQDEEAREGFLREQGKDAAEGQEKGFRESLKKGQEKDVAEGFAGEQWKAGEAASFTGNRSGIFGKERVAESFLLIWAAGAIIVFGYSLISYGRLRKRVRCAIRLDQDAELSDWMRENQKRWNPERIYLADEIELPFVMGVFRPGIYIPSSLERKNLPYVIAHEEAHIRRGDHLLKLIGFLAAGLYWYHPAVWLGFRLMNRDMEMACDEAVMRRMGETERGDYAASLLLLTCGKRGFAAAPLAFSEGNTEGRIKHIMKYKRPAVAAAVFGIALTLVLAAGLLTSRKAAAGEGGTGRKGAAGEQWNPGEDTLGTPDSGTSGNAGDQSADRGQASREDKTRVISSWQKRQLDILPPALLPDENREIRELVLDYADEEAMVFHGIFGDDVYLYVYREETGKLEGVVDLEGIGCGGLPGEESPGALSGTSSGKEAPDIYAAEGGRKVYIHPRGREKRFVETDDNGTQQTVIQDEGYCYDVETGELTWICYSCPDSETENTTALFRNIAGIDLSRAAELVDVQAGPLPFDGLISDRQARFPEGHGVGTYGYLVSADGSSDSLVYVRGTRFVRLFGETAEGRQISYDDSTKVTIDGAVYDLTEQSDMTNAVMSASYADGMWIIEGHINPDVASWHFFDTGKGEWLDCVFGTNLTWDKEAHEPQADHFRDTMIYDCHHILYDCEGELLDLREALSEKQEYIAGLARKGDTLTVILRSDYREEGYRRELRISLSEARRER